MADPLISIIIPVHNAEKHLRQTIESAIAQSWQNKEIIIVDDGSTDGSVAVAKPYENKLVRVFCQPNKGASAARNTGLRHAKGNYIQFLDADDLLSEDKLHNQIKALQNNSNKVAVCSTVHFMDGSLHTSATVSDYEELFLINTNDSAYFLTNLWGGYGENGSMVQPNAWLTPRTIIDKAGPWNESLTVDDDGEYFCRVLLASAGVIKTAGYNYYRRYQNNNFSLSASKLQEHYLSLFISLTLRYEHIAAKNDTDALKKAYGRSLYQVEHSMYPSFPNLRRRIKKVIRELDVVITNKPPAKERLKKRAVDILGPQLTNMLKGMRTSPKK